MDANDLKWDMTEKQEVKEDKGLKHIRITNSLIQDLKVRKLDENLNHRLWEFMLQQRYKLYKALEGRLAKFGGVLHVEGREEIYEFEGDAGVKQDRPDTDNTGLKRHQDGCPVGIYAGEPSAESDHEPQNWKEWNESKKAYQIQKPTVVVNEQVPSICRMVVYNHPGSADGKYPPQQSPAVIQHVNEDGTCRLWVFGPKGIHNDDNLVQGDGPSQWNWPPRV